MATPDARIVGVLLCAGSSERMGFDKLVTPLAGKSAIQRSAEALIAGGVSELILAVSERTRAHAQSLALPVPVSFAPGGATRLLSVRNALRTGDGDVVVIHDAARCMVAPQVIMRCIDSALSCGSGIACTRASDTVFVEDAFGTICAPPRQSVLLAQTPQAFGYAQIRRAYETAPPDSRATDDCTLYLHAGHVPHFIEAGPDNFKLTGPADWSRALTHFAPGGAVTGTGFDTHRLVPDRRLVLGGVDIPFEKGLLGHSDADVLAHALIDALLGAANLGDIGALYPDTDSRYAGADSLLLLADTAARVREKGYTPLHLDATVIAQRPRLRPYIPEMCARLARAVSLPEARVSVKATTTEGCNDEGRGLCISAQAVASLLPPADG